MKLDSDFHAHATAQTHTRVNKNLKENLKFLCIKGHYQKYKQRNQEKYVNYILRVYYLDI